MKNILVYLFVFVLITSCSDNKGKNDDFNRSSKNLQYKSEDWKNLLAGGDLSDWVILGSDEAIFYMDNGVLVGETQKNLPNSFLATKKGYGDFILKLEFKVAKELNSGIQIRSGRYKETVTTNYVSGKLEESERTWEEGRVFGYQIEIDPSSRAWTGGLYEEGGRGWIYPLIENEAARNAYKQEDWNEFKIIANDNHFQSWINNVKAADFYDDEKCCGFIAIQLHSTNRDELVGKKIMFRNIRIKELP